MSARQVYDDPNAIKLNDVCEFVGVLSRVPGLAAAQLEAHSNGGGGGGPTGESDEEGLLDGEDELARDEALAMTPTSLVRCSLVFGPVVERTLPELSTATSSAAPQPDSAPSRALPPGLANGSQTSTCSKWSGSMRT